MIIFACDSSGRTASASILKDNQIISEELVDEGLTHSEMLMPLCERVFNAAGMTPDDIDYFAVSCGPGSFTGLRIGIGVIKGMALAVNKPCVAVPTLEALASSCKETGVTVIPVCDARRGRVFCSSFRKDNYITRLTEDTVLETEKLSELFGSGMNVFVGDAAEICYNTFCSGYSVSAGDSNVNSEFVAQAAIGYIERGMAVSAESLSPFYLQLSQAERELSEKKKGIQK